MSKSFTLFLFIIGILSSSLSAKNSDTLLIRNTGIDVLAKMILGDTLSDGRRADMNRVYVLMRGER